jgi:hypothetical protein
LNEILHFESLEHFRITSFWHQAANRDEETRCIPIPPYHTLCASFVYQLPIARRPLPIAHRPSPIGLDCVVIILNSPGLVAAIRFYLEFEIYTLLRNKRQIQSLKA